MLKKNEEQRKRRSGFTLIELLIVVAIIGILAAIAVPNFLEAQVRAKVARSQADMRTIATGLESYYVDNNIYVRPREVVATHWSDPTIPYRKYDTNIGRYLIPLTTPVAYLAELPTYEWAPFRLFSDCDPITLDTTGYGPIDCYYYRYDTRYMWKNSLWAKADGETWYQWDPEDRKMWCLSAVGPDGESNQDQAWEGVVWPDLPTSGSMTQQYDATNGTVSNGDIIRMGP